MIKYWGIWHIVCKKWWIPYEEGYLENWEEHDIIRVKQNITKIINSVPIWDHQDFELGQNLLFTSWEVREFTPADALLVKCGKT